MSIILTKASCSISELIHAQTAVKASNARFVFTYSNGNSGAYEIVFDTNESYVSFSGLFDTLVNPPKYKEINSGLFKRTKNKIVGFIKNIGN
jgi:hypothetical protein